MQQYKVINDQPIPEHLFFWRYSDYKARSKTPPRSKSPLRKQRDPIKPTAQRLEEEALIQCTFKPQLFSNNNRFWQSSEGQFIQRCQQYEEQRQAKLMKQRMYEVENQLRECTFQPKISQFVKNANVINLNESNKKPTEQRSQYKMPTKQLYRYSDALNLLHKELHG